MPYVDLNSDLGESFGSYRIGLDQEIMSHISSANLACGWHAGDPLVMAQSLEAAKTANVAVGAHPGLPDLLGFGRREMRISPEEAKRYVQYQIGALTALAESFGLSLQHVKLHGAFYNMAAHDEVLARAVCEGIAGVDRRLIVLALANSPMLRIAAECGLHTASEVFADRAYQDDGLLVSRNQPGAVLHDPEQGLQQVLRMVKEGCVRTINGKEIAIQAHSICVHGDNPQAVAFVAEIRALLARENIQVTTIRDIISKR